MKHTLPLLLVFLLCTACSSSKGGGPGPDAVADVRAPDVVEVASEVAVPDTVADNGPDVFEVAPDLKPDSGPEILPDAGDAGAEAEAPKCKDGDGDGYGIGCDLGLDCDDANPHFATECPPCGAKHIQYCACGPLGATELCYDYDGETLDVGECKPGVRTCDEKGFWTGCESQVGPVLEECNGLDEDCDGVTDNGVMNACGNCDPACTTLEAGPDTANPFVLDAENSKGVGTDFDGYIVLDSSKANNNFIWIANSGEGTVTRLNTETGEEVGRYKTCSDPSRTAVDLVGDVWVACRADGGVARIAVDQAMCVDKNGDGEIQTSTGSVALAPGKDECILFTVYPGGSCQRAVGVDKENNAWVGDWDNMKLRKLSPENGSTLQTVSIPANPYGLAIDFQGRIWVSGRGGDLLVKVDPSQDPPEVKSWYVEGGNLYGIAVDFEGYIWLGQYSNGSVARFSPYDESIKIISDKLAGHCPRGMAASIDRFVYTGLGCDVDHYVGRINTNNLQVDLMDINGPNGLGQQPIGVALDAYGYLWAVNYMSSNASKVDTKTGEVFGPYPVGSYPYTYSDMTGYALNNFTAPQGHYATTFAAPEGVAVAWKALLVEADMPNNAALKVEVRAGGSEEELAAGPWQGPFGPYPPGEFPLDLAAVPGLSGALLEVKVWLFSKDNVATPVVKAIKVSYGLVP